ncbi:MAG: hypothetical protein AAF449_13695, partial [Myxococcota bacterium]
VARAAPIGRDPCVYKTPTARKMSLHQGTDPFETCRYCVEIVAFCRPQEEGAYREYATDDNER